MTDLLTWSGLSAHSAFGIMMALVYPVLAVASLEIARTMSPERTLVASCLRQLAYLVLPTGAIWLILRILELLPVWWTPSLGCFLKLEGADGAATVQPGVQAGGSPAG